MLPSKHVALVIDSALPQCATITDFSLALALDVPPDRRLRIFEALPLARRERMWTELADRRAAAQTALG